MFSNPAYGGLPAATPGLIARIKTPEGSIMGVNYATNESFAEEHTGVNVPVFANQVGQELIAPMITQPDIFFITAGHLGLK
jgi:alkaline phosphatase